MMPCTKLMPLVCHEIPESKQSQNVCSEHYKKQESRLFSSLCRSAEPSLAGMLGAVIS